MNQPCPTLSDRVEAPPVSLDVRSPCRAPRRLTRRMRALEREVPADALAAPLELTIVPARSVLRCTDDGEEHPRIGAVLGDASERGRRRGREPAVVGVTELAEVGQSSSSAGGLERRDRLDDGDVFLETIAEPADDVFVQAPSSSRIMTRELGVVSNVTVFESVGFVFVIR